MEILQQNVSRAASNLQVLTIESSAFTFEKHFTQLALEEG